MVRGAVVLPHGTGKTRARARVRQGRQGKEAQEAGADFVGTDDLVDKLQKETSWTSTRVVATPDMMGLVGKLGRVLGPRGLMPNPKVGTVTFDVATAVARAKGGKVEYRVEKAGIVHARIGKVSFGGEKLRDNARRSSSCSCKLEAVDGQGHLHPEHHRLVDHGPGHQDRRQRIQASSWAKPIGTRRRQQGPRGGLIDCRDRSQMDASTKSTGRELKDKLDKTRLDRPATSGIDVRRVTKLRDEFRKAGVEYKVVKNTLVKHAIKGTAYGGKLDDVLVGMTAIVLELRRSQSRPPRSSRLPQGRSEKLADQGRDSSKARSSTRKAVESSSRRCRARTSSAPRCSRRFQAPLQQFVAHARTRPRRTSSTSLARERARARKRGHRPSQDFDIRIRVRRIDMADITMEQIVDYLSNLPGHPDCRAHQDARRQVGRQGRSGCRRRPGRWRRLRPLPAAEEQTEFTVELSEAGANKINVIKASARSRALASRKPRTSSTARRRRQGGRLQGRGRGDQEEARRGGRQGRAQVSRGRSRGRAI